MIKVNKLFDLMNQVWRHIVTSSLIGQIKQLVYFNHLLNQWKRLYNWVQGFLFPYTVPSNSSGTKWKYFLTLTKYMLILNGLCKQYNRDLVLRNMGPDLRSILFDSQHHVLLNTAFCTGWLIFWGYRDFVTFIDCPKTFVEHCITVAFWMPLPLRKVLWNLAVFPQNTL